MSWRIVNVAHKSHLSLKNNNLIIKQGEEYRLPLEDIGVLMLENHSITTSAALLNACVQHKIAVFVCDDTHVPSGVLLGYQQHSRQRKVISSQMSLSEPFKKRLWQTIVKQKISNQKYVFEKILKTTQPQFDTFIKSVNSGDTLNREATAARLYFSKLLPEGSTRGSDSIYNAALNYGYAIVRGAVARSLVSYGFLPSNGIKHINVLNNYALADDFLEAYRPFVDYFVFENINDRQEELTKDIRNDLVGVLTHAVSIDNKENTILRAIEITAQSFVTAINENEPRKLLLPKFI